MQKRAFENAMASPEPASEPDPLEDDPELLRRVEVPALVAVGEHDLPDFHTAAWSWPTSWTEAFTIPGARHMAPLETPEAFLELLLPFLR